jgi:hypothetical protein
MRRQHTYSPMVVTSSVPKLSEPQDWFEKQVRRRLKRQLKERLDELKG